MWGIHDQGSWILEIHDQSADRYGFWRGPTFWFVHTCLHIAKSSYGLSSMCAHRGERAKSLCFLIRILISSWGPHLQPGLNLDNSQSPHLQQGLQHLNFWRDMNIQSITVFNFDYQFMHFSSNQQHFGFQALNWYLQCVHTHHILKTVLVRTYVRWTLWIKIWSK